VLAVAAVLLAGCTSTSSGVGAPSTFRSSPAAAGSSSPSASTSAPANPDQVKAEETVVAYWAMIDLLAAHPDLSLTRLSNVAEGKALSAWQQILTKQRGQGVVQVGSSLVDDPRATQQADGSWAVSVCLDVSGVDLLDRAGKSVVNAGRPDRVDYDYVVSKVGARFLVATEKAVGTC
jgi:hypothetical protein